MITRRFWILTVLSVFVGLGLLAGCAQEKKPDQTPATTSPATVSPAAPTTSKEKKVASFPKPAAPRPKLLAKKVITKSETESQSESAPQAPLRTESIDKSTESEDKSADLPDESAESEKEAFGSGKRLFSMAEPDESEYTVMKIFYGTDRTSSSALQANRVLYMSWLKTTVGAAAVTLLLSLLAFRFVSSRLIRILAYGGLIATLILAALTTWVRFQYLLPGKAATLPSTPALSYGNQRGKLELGTCEVSIPKSHEVGELESPSVLRLEFIEDPSRHVVLLKVQNEPAEKFFAELRSCVGRSADKSAFVFVHGYNVTFEDAARRTAQIAYDLKFQGAPILFSWPSQGGIWSYTVDETNVTWAVPHLCRFLADVARQSGAKQIHLVAHSMGNRALTSALKDLSFLPESSRPYFNEVLLTAPDIDAEVFKDDLAPAIVKVAKRVTLYASSNDEALILSKKVHGYPRAGDSGDQLVVIPGVDTVDVSAVDTSLLGHTYYGDNSTVLADIFEVLHGAKPADKRQWLLPKHLGLLRYWIFRHSDSERPEPENL